MSMERHEEIQALLADHVLGGLTGEERQRVDSHAASCPSCAAELRELGLAFKGIGLAEEPVPPPPHLRAKVLERLQRESAGPVGTVARNDLNTRGGPSYGVWLALAATTTLVLGASLFLSLQRNGNLRQALQHADGAYADLEGRVRQNTEQADLAVSILTSPDMRRIDLEGFEASREAVARAYWSPARGLLIVADRLPAPPPGRVYQVWLIGSSSAGPVSAGVLDDPRSGRGMLIVPAPAGVSGETVTVAVTDEPPGGLAAPTGGKHLAGS